ncbi:cell division control protein [Auriculariales sp. MPI-PUGE-AT-0066]|nr:cell division control protein [Auriculariales sp. MPI-PUGE-AT-0066]
MDHIKCLVVGDGGVGKTCLIIVHTTNTYPTTYVPTVADSWAETVYVGDKPYNLGYWDIAGQGEYERLRPLSYPQTDIFIACFDIARASSFENIESVWIPEISHFCPGVPFILVGMKSDLRVGEAVDVPPHESFVSYKQGEDLARRLGAAGYLECSSLRQEGITRLFEEAVRVATWPRPRVQEGRKGCCTLL